MSKSFFGMGYTWMFKIGQVPRQVDPRSKTACKVKGPTNSMLLSKEGFRLGMHRNYVQIIANAHSQARFLGNVQIQWV